MIFNAFLGALLALVMIFGGMIAAGALTKYVGPEAVIYAVIVPLVALAVILLKPR